MMAWRWLIAVLCWFLVSGSWGHESRPVFVQVLEQSAGQYQLQWKIPFSVPVASFPTVRMPDICEAKSQVALKRQSDAFLKQQSFRCSSILSSQTLEIQHPGINPSVSTLFQVKLQNGEEYTRILKPGENRWQIPAEETPGAVAREYSLLGIQHIWEGVDHLLFVACLIFIARTPRRILLTITGFTLAHSLTLALSTLQLVSLPVPPVEAAIALSIIFLAHEIAKPSAASWTWRYPVIVSSVFGLLHGFGFAAVLREIGLPQTELPLALLMFNVGVEIGQVLFVLACVLIFIGLKRLLLLATLSMDFRQVSTATAYLVGTLASFWFVERMTGF